jgi:hypothetical protein
MEPTSDQQKSDSKRLLPWAIGGCAVVLVCGVLLVVLIGVGVAASGSSSRIQTLLTELGLRGSSERQTAGGGAAETAAPDVSGGQQESAAGAGEEGGGQQAGAGEGEAQPPTATQPPATATPGGGTAGAVGEEDFTRLIEEGAITVISVDSPGTAGITGPGVLVVNVSNPGSQQITVTIPAGYVFFPPAGSAEQRMMVLQSASVVVPAGGTAALSPYVACIDSNATPPGIGSAYTPGSMVEDEDLLSLAQCLDQQELPVIDYTGAPDSAGEVVIQTMGLQFAVWSVTEGENYAEFMAQFAATPEAGGAAGSIPGMGDMGSWASATQMWLDLCNVQFDR